MSTVILKETKLQAALAPQRLAMAFKAFRESFPPPPPRPAQQFYDIGKIQYAFQQLKAPLSSAKANGGMINPWALAGLKNYEVRNCSALAGLWMTEFGGDVSRKFLASYLDIALKDFLPDVVWEDELSAGYKIEAEVNPLGEASDRVDLVIQSAMHLVGIEVKIDAGLGTDQLKRYWKALGQQAKLLKLKPVLVLLAPFESPMPEVASTHWGDVTLASKMAAGTRIVERNFIQQLVASFGDHVSNF